MGLKGPQGKAEGARVQQMVNPIGGELQLHRGPGVGDHPQGIALPGQAFQHLPDAGQQGIVTRHVVGVVLRQGGGLGRGHAQGGERLPQELVPVGDLGNLLG